MAQETDLKLTVKDFGPIKEGIIDLKPLTILIGPNNSGKSYMALLIYALMRAVLAQPAFPLAFRSIARRRHRFDPNFAGLRELQPLQAELERWLPSIAQRKRPMKYSGLPRALREALLSAVQSRLIELSRTCQENLKEYFGVDDLHKLIHYQHETSMLSVTLEASGVGTPMMSLQVASDVSKRKVETEPINWALPRLASVAIPLGDLRALATRQDSWMIAASLLVEQLFWNWMEQNGITSEVYYLPAARSGILQAWPMLVSMAITTARRRAVRERIEIAPVSGVAADFLEVFLDELVTPQRPRPDKNMQPAVSALEEDVFRGNVSIEDVQSGAPSIMYKSGDLGLPLARASSMIGELAPLDLWLRFLLRPGDLLVLEEPEAHLHPQYQRRIATVIVRLVQAGVRVICPTHSSLILHQISNHLLASQKDRPTRQSLGFSEHDIISSDQIGVYLFQAQEDGTHVRAVSVDQDYGIPEDEFLQVAEAIGEETYRLATP